MRTPEELEAANERLAVANARLERSNSQLITEAAARETAERELRRSLADLNRAVAELEQFVQGMEGGRLPLEVSIAAYRRGSDLLKHCQQQLSDAENKIQILENGVLRDFDVSAGGSR